MFNQPLKEFIWQRLNSVRMVVDTDDNIRIPVPQYGVQIVIVNSNQAELRTDNPLLEIEYRVESISGKPTISKNGYFREDLSSKERKARNNMFSQFRTAFQKYAQEGLKQGFEKKQLLQDFVNIGTQLWIEPTHQGEKIGDLQFAEFQIAITGIRTPYNLQFFETFFSAIHDRYPKN